MNSGISPNLCRSEGRDVREQVRVVGLPQRGAKANPLAANAIGNDVLEAAECATKDEQHVGGVDLDELLVRVLASTLRRHRSHRALKNLQQRLLHALARNVPGNRRILRLARYLVDLVDVDDASLRLVHVVVGGLQQLEEDVLHVFANVTGLGERRSVGDGERHVEHSRESLREIRLAATRRPNEQHVGLGDVDGLFVGARLGLANAHALVVVVDRHRQGALRRILPHDVLLEEREDLARLWHLNELLLDRFSELLVEDLVAQPDALVADVHGRARDELAHLLLRLTAERALQQIAAVGWSRHEGPFPCPLQGTEMARRWLGDAPPLTCA